MWNPFGKRKKFNEANATAFTQELAQPVQREAAEYRISRPPEEKHIACIVTHGMGQQVPFETVGALAESLVTGEPNAHVMVNRVRLSANKADDPISRIEIYLAGEEGVRPNIRLHLYEGYWAPLTEGKVTFYESCRFLLGGAWKGIRSCLSRKQFSRWVFGEMREFSIKPNTFVDLLITLFFLGLGLGLGALLESKVQHAYTAAKGWMHAHPHLFAHVLNVVRGLVSKAWTWSVLLFHHPFTAIGELWNALLSGVALLWSNALDVVILAFSGLYIYYLHYFMVEFVGDVAIYVSSHRVSKFEEVRTAIQKNVFKVASQVYLATGDAAALKKLYDRIFLVGHSLGSVISYDLLNELIVWDQKVYGGDQKVVARTSRLITFGSPLDKTAFLFRSQVSPNHHYREALAALQQPLILDYALRPADSFKWVNIYSWADVVSGNLIYYDLPDSKVHPPPTVQRNPVQNRVAPECWIPIVAHTQYWSGSTLRDEMWKAILESDNLGPD